MNATAYIRSLLCARNHCYMEALTAQMERKENQEAYWWHQYRRADEALRDACARAGITPPDVQQLPLFLSGDEGVTFVTE